MGNHHPFVKFSSLFGDVDVFIDSMRILISLPRFNFEGITGKMDIYVYNYNDFPVFRSGMLLNSNKVGDLFLQESNARTQIKLDNDEQYIPDSMKKTIETVVIAQIQNDKELRVAIVSEYLRKEIDILQGRIDAIKEKLS